MIQARGNRVPELEAEVQEVPELVPEPAKGRVLVDAKANGVTPEMSIVQIFGCKYMRNLLVSLIFYRNFFLPVKHALCRQGDR